MIMDFLISLRMAIQKAYKLLNGHYYVTGMTRTRLPGMDNLVYLNCSDQEDIEYDSMYKV